VPRARRGRRCADVASGLLLALVASAAQAQWSGSAAVMSDYRYRGLSLTNDEPAAQLGVVYDDPRDWYAGALATTALARCGHECGGVQVDSYAGYASRLPSGATLDAGGNFRFSTGSQAYSFAELYLGLNYFDTTARVNFSPRYFGQDTRSAYVELAQSLKIHDRVRLLGHVGLLHVDNVPAYAPARTTTMDVLLGAALDVGPFEARVTWQHTATPVYVYAASVGDRRSRFVVELRYPF
jgi:uncharacterized protein (TIGR02001 family)